MSMQFSDEMWYAPMEKIPNQIYDNKDETIFRCRKKVFDGLLEFMFRQRNYWRQKVRKLIKNKGKNTDFTRIKKYGNSVERVITVMLNGCVAC